MAVQVLVVGWLALLLAGFKSLAATSPAGAPAPLAALCADPFSRSAQCMLDVIAYDMQPTRHAVRRCYCRQVSLAVLMLTRCSNRCAAYKAAHRLRTLCSAPLPLHRFWKRWINGVTVIEALLYTWIVACEVRATNLVLPVQLCNCCRSQASLRTKTRVCWTACHACTGAGQRCTWRVALPRERVYA